MLSENSFGQTYFMGPVRITQTLPHKICIQFSSGKTRIIRQVKRLHPMDKFCKEGEGYVLKQSISSLENHHPQDSEKLYQNQDVWDPDQCYRDLI